jgi:type I restriction-modification system DNA methylase subunit
MANSFKSEIIKHLERAATYGSYDHSRTFDDFLSLALVCMNELPRQYASAVKTKQLTEDLPETKEVFSRLRNAYKPQAFEHFTKAFGALLASVEEWADTIGDVYMEFGHPNSGTGQFFTPFSISKMTAAVMAGNIEVEIHDRIRAAIAKDPFAQAALYAGLVITDPEQARRHYLDTVLPAALPHLDPIKVCDPACGSGVMFLAFASECPRWALDYGIVQFWGMDIDQTCVDMARLNVKLYGLNGYGIKHVLELQARELEAIPEPYQSTYREVIEDPSRIEEVTQRVAEFRQGVLF